MSGLDVTYINPFLVGATAILGQACGVSAKVGKPSVKEMKFTEESILIIIGVTGEIRGQVIMEFPYQMACDIAGKMMMMPSPLPELDEMGISAISELGNMILGNTATLFSGKGIGIDITPPTVCKGDVRFTTKFTQSLCIPITYEGGNEAICLHVAITNED